MAGHLKELKFLLVPPLRTLPLSPTAEHSSSLAQSSALDGTVHLLHDAVEQSSLEALLHAARNTMMEATGDTVDGSPTYHAHIMEDGTPVGDAAVASLAQPLIDEQIVPYVRELTGCPEAVVSDALIRRYVPGERLGLSAHFDVSAFATAILPLSDPADYAGGLYLQPEPHASSR